MDQYRKTPRAKWLEYNEGKYFITICTSGMRHYFGEILDGEMQLSDIGAFAASQIELASHFNDAIEIPLYVVMPNHIHMVVFVDAHMEESYSGGEPVDTRYPNPALRVNPGLPRTTPMLSRYINKFKGAVTKYARQNGLSFAWHSRYHDHVIRNNRDGNNISEYILNNVARWDSDCFNEKNSCR